jgi:transcriptional regulator with XRE-family HTH domain
MDRQDTSKMIRELRADPGLTQEQFAAKLGVTYSTINRLESKKGNPSPLAMLRIEKLRK